MHVIVIQCKLQKVLCCPGQRAELHGKSMHPVCLDGKYGKPVQGLYGHILCFACLKEDLRPQKPYCGLCCSTPALGIEAVVPHRHIKSTETSHHVCCNNFFLSSRFTWLHVPDTRITSYKRWSPPLRMHPSRGEMTHTGTPLFDFTILRT